MPDTTAAAAIIETTPASKTTVAAASAATTPAPIDPQITAWLTNNSQFQNHQAVTAALATQGIDFPTFMGQISASPDISTFLTSGATQPVTLTPAPVETGAVAGVTNDNPTTALAGANAGAPVIVKCGDTTVDVKNVNAPEVTATGGSPVAAAVNAPETTAAAKNDNAALGTTTDLMNLSTAVGSNSFAQTVGTREPIVAKEPISPTSLVPSDVAQTVGAGAAASR